MCKEIVPTTSFNLENRHLLVTGASSGIGRATSVLLSQLGARVSLLARRQIELNNTISSMAGNGHAIFPCDLSNLDSIFPCVEEIVSFMGPLDGLVHCAGQTRNRPLNMTKPDFASTMMTINFNAFLELVRTATKKKLVNDGASIVGVSSVASIGGGKAQTAYAASKAAMNGIIPPLAKELAPRRIRINAVAFGMINTKMFDYFKDGGNTAHLLERQYLGIGNPDDAAKIISFLLSDYSILITGSILIADCGYLS
jgi:NAD(P)-dependent dehydrogenase (short-subunit alcohol dehydrogenase family)